MCKLPALFASLYLILVALAIIPIFTGADALSGIFAVILSGPWSMPLSNLIPDALVESSILPGIVVVCIGATINAAIIYFISRWIIRKIRP